VLASLAEVPAALACVPASLAEVPAALACVPASLADAPALLAWLLASVAELGQPCFVLLWPTCPHCWLAPGHRWRSCWPPRLERPLPWRRCPHWRLLVRRYWPLSWLDPRHRGLHRLLVARYRPSEWLGRRCAALRRLPAMIERRRAGFRRPSCRPAGPSLVIAVRPERRFALHLWRRWPAAVRCSWPLGWRWLVAEQHWLRLPLAVFPLRLLGLPDGPSRHRYGLEPIALPAASEWCRVPWRA